MRKITAAAHLIFELSALLDKGESVPVQTIRDHISNRDVIECLEQLYPREGENALDLSMFQEVDRNYIHDQLESYLCGYTDGRKWGITENGLCLLITWLTEIMMDVNGRDLDNASDWIEEES